MISPNEACDGPCLKIEALSKWFGTIHVIDELNLSLSEGEIVALVGRSGCGKSTLLRLIAGLDEPDLGQISHRSSCPINRLRVLFQEARLLPWKSVLDNVGLGQQGKWRSEAVPMLESVGLGGREQEWPLNLSGGQRQRVSLARALLSHPTLLLMDEPFGALDALTKLEMHSLFERIREGNGFAAIIVTHDVSEAVFLADRVMVMESGRIAETVEIPLERPRNRAMPEFARLEGLLLKRLLPDV